MITFDWKPINVESMAGVFLRGDPPSVVDHTTFNEYKLGDLTEENDIGGGWFRNSYMIYSAAHSSPILEGSGITGKIGFYPTWIDDGSVVENEFYLRNIKLVEMSQGTTELQFSKYNCRNMMYCSTVCYDNPIPNDWGYGDDYIITGYTKEEMEKRCSFADWNRSQELTSDDYDNCREAIDNLTTEPYDYTASLQSVEWSGGGGSNWESNKVPTFLDESGYTEFNDLISENEGDVIYHQYVNVVPKPNSVGRALVRMDMTDNGLNEDGTLSHIRTGYSVSELEVAGVSTLGPTGSFLSIEKASMGIVPDTYQYILQGNDALEMSPYTGHGAHLTKNVVVLPKGFHPITWDSEDTIHELCGTDDAYNVAVGNGV